MAKPRVEVSLEDILLHLQDEIRKIKLDQRKVGNWTLVEDQTTGDLYATRYNGQGVAQTVVLLALA